jgi:hypothetical protein
MSAIKRFFARWTDNDTWTIIWLGFILGVFALAR